MIVVIASAMKVQTAMNTARILSGQGDACLGEELGDRFGGSGGATAFVRGTYQAAADDHPVGRSADLGDLRRGPDPEADRDRGLPRRGLRRGDQLGQLRRQLAALT